jgi:DHA1 family tetracycline resistance protein-like MFS transporter
VFGLGCDYVLLALAPNLWGLFVGRLIAGATFPKAWTWRNGVA